MSTHHPSSPSFSARALVVAASTLFVAVMVGGGCGGELTSQCERLAYLDCKSSPQCVSVYRYDIVVNGVGTGACAVACDEDGECPEDTDSATAVPWAEIIEDMNGDICACLPKSWNGGGYPAYMLGARRKR